MSLKAFHIVFIVFSTLLALGTSGWCIWVDLVVGGPIYLAGAIALLVVAIALMFFGFWFWREMQRLGIFTCSDSDRYCWFRFCLRHGRRCRALFATAPRTANRRSTWLLRFGFFLVL